MIAKISKKELVAKNTWLFEFALSKKVLYEPGQSFRLTIPDTGSRFFSIARPPALDRVTTVTRLGKSDFKKKLFSLAIGDIVDVSSIAGDFTLPKKDEQDYVFIAGGIGITPFVSMIDYLSSPKSKARVMLLYSNPDEQSCAFLDELRELERTNNRFRLVIAFTSQGGHRIDAEFLKKNLRKPKGNLYYVAGPVQMVNELFEELLKFGADPDSIKTEEFTGYLDGT